MTQSHDEMLARVRRMLTDDETWGVITPELQDALRYVLNLLPPVGIEWNNENDMPSQKGWYLCDAVDGRWNGEYRYRAWGNGSWWIPLADGWFSSPIGLYRWHGPVADIDGPSPDGSNPCRQPTRNQIDSDGGDE